MPAVNFNLYDNFRLRQNNGGAIDFDTATLKVAIVTGAYTPLQNVHNFWNDVEANEVSGTGYTAGGNTCANIAVDLAVDGLVTVDCADPAVWAQNGAGFSNGRRAIVYEDSGLAITSGLIGYSDDFGVDQGNVAGSFTVTINPNGLFTSARI